MVITKNKDFVEIEYTGRADGEVFDTTDESLANKEDLPKNNAVYGPITICLGESHLVKGLDKELIGKETNKEYTIELSPENAFGKKKAELFKLIPRSTFLKQEINPMPGLQVNIEGVVGTVKTVSGGRVYVDFNHYLSGKDINYEVKINKIITKTEDKVKALLNLMLGKIPQINIKEKTVDITFDVKVSDELKTELKKNIINLTEITKVDFSVKKEKTKQPTKKQSKDDNKQV
jgi:FKBP-type peptidyl-prolyl cis-trans isomerase SlyD